jgi:hypothetical protein
VHITEQVSRMKLWTDLRFPNMHVSEMLSFVYQIARAR